MATSFEGLHILHEVETITDNVWKEVSRWDKFAKNVVGKQVARACDSIGANIAESYGRYHYGEKLNFLYYARGSLFETKYWLNRALTRNLLLPTQVDKYATQLTRIARQLNAFAKSLKSQRHHKPTSSAIKESEIEYYVSEDIELFNQDDLDWLLTYSTQLPQSPISNLQSPP